MARRPVRKTQQRETGHRANEAIKVPEVQLIDEDGNNVGVVPIEEALDKASQAGMDLVEISPNAQPPICKVLDFGKFKYLAQKKAAENRKKQKIVEVKEIKMTPNIDQHDYAVKMRNMDRFFENGDKVKISIRFKGREMAHKQLGRKLLERVKEEIPENIKVELEPKMEGKQMMMILAPK